MVNERQDLSVFLTVGTILLYGIAALVVSWIDFAEGPCGGIGTKICGAVGLVIQTTTTMDVI